MQTVPMIRPTDGATVPILVGDVAGMRANGYSFARPEDRQRFDPGDPDDLVPMIRPDGAEIPVRRGEVGAHEAQGCRMKPFKAKDAPSAPQPRKSEPRTVTMPAPGTPDPLFDDPAAGKRKKS